MYLTHGTLKLTRGGCVMTSADLHVETVEHWAEDDAMFSLALTSEPPTGGSHRCNVSPRTALCISAVNLLYVINAACIWNNALQSRMNRRLFINLTIQITGVTARWSVMAKRGGTPCYTLKNGFLWNEGSFVKTCFLRRGDTVWLTACSVVLSFFKEVQGFQRTQLRVCQRGCFKTFM